VTATLELQHLSFGYQAPGDTLQDFSLSVEAGELVALLGPSGCGKTTLLKLICGLLPPEKGDIRVRGRSLLGLPPEKRDITMVFQQDQLFEHMTLAENIGFGLRMRGHKPAHIAAEVTAILDQVQLGGLETRKPRQLSGGQRQRGALARALVTGPSVMLLDEPLSALDASLRDELRSLLLHLQRQRRQTSLFVTHDQEEALRLADRVAIVFDGRLHMLAPPRECVERPLSRRIAEFMGTANFIPAHLDGRMAQTPLGPLQLDQPHPPGPACLCVRPEALRLGSGNNSFEARVQAISYRGDHLYCELLAGNLPLEAKLPSDAQLKHGDRLQLHMAPQALWRLPETKGDVQP